MKFFLPIFVLMLAASGLAGCVNSGLLGQTAEYHSTRTAAQMDADEARIERGENKARAHEREDSRAQAEDTEIATRHNPTSVSSTTVVSPGWWW